MLESLISHGIEGGHQFPTSHLGAIHKLRRWHLTGPSRGQGLPNVNGKVKHFVNLSTKWDGVKNARSLWMTPFIQLQRALNMTLLICKKEFWPNYFNGLDNMYRLNVIGKKNRPKVNKNYHRRLHHTVLGLEFISTFIINYLCLNTLTYIYIKDYKKIWKKSVISIVISYHTQNQQIECRWPITKSATLLQK